MNVGVCLQGSDILWVVSGQTEASICWTVRYRITMREAGASERRLTIRRDSGQGEWRFLDCLHPFIWRWEPSFCLELGLSPSQRWKAPDWIDEHLSASFSHPIITNRPPLMHTDSEEHPHQGGGMFCMLLLFLQTAYHDWPLGASSLQTTRGHHIVSWSIAADVRHVRHTFVPPEGKRRWWGQFFWLPRVTDWSVAIPFFSEPWQSDLRIQRQYRLTIWTQQYASEDTGQNPR